MTDAIEPVTAEATVPLSQVDAFALFTVQFERWWPRDYSFSGKVLEALVFGNGLGEWCFERGPNGFRCDWARIVEWEPPSRVCFDWHIGPTRVLQPDPSGVSTVRVTFDSQGAKQTRVRVTHDGFARHGEGAAQYRADMASAYGWPRLMQQYAAAAAR